ncbi:hypothetical protein D3C78_1330830 [compost metagenome]
MFPVIVSLYWDRVNNSAFTCSVLAAFVVFLLVRFAWLPLTGTTAYVLELVACIGAGVVIGLMAFGLLGKRVGMVCGLLAALAVLPWAWGEMRGYPVLLSSLLAYGVSAIVCTAMSLRNAQRFDFALIGQRVTNFQAA